MSEPKYPTSTEENEKLLESFVYHPPKEDQEERYVEIRGMAHALAKLIKESTPKSREQSLSITKLEESVMWANKAIAVNE